MKSHVTWLTAEQAAIYLGYVDGDGHARMAAFYKWKERARPRTHRLRGSLRFRAVDLDACIEPEPEAKPTTLHVVSRGRRHA